MLRFMRLMQKTGRHDMKIHAMKHRVGGDVAGDCSGRQRPRLSNIPTNEQEKAES